MGFRGGLSDMSELAKVAYEAYTASSGGKNYRGDPCPAWHELPEAIRGHWRAVAVALGPERHTIKAQPAGGEA